MPPILHYIKLLSGVFLGWSLGSNNSANMFGTAVASQMVRWKLAAALIAVFAMLGALLQGHEGLRTIGALSEQTINTAFLVCLSAALTTTIMTICKIPVSTSQAVVGAIIGIGLHGNGFDFSTIPLHKLQKIATCWVATPIGAAILAFLLYPLLGKLLRKRNPHFLSYDRFMRSLLIAAGIYGAYALGANNVANVTGVFVQAGTMPIWSALLVGGASISLGALTYSREVMMTVGRKIIKLDAFSALVVVLSEAITVHIFAIIGVPVSTSQAVVGAVLGIGVLKGIRTVSGWTLLKILIGWILTPVIGGVLAILLLLV